LAGSNSIKKELFRKSIHIAGLSVPFMSIAAGMPAAASFVAALATAYCISEYLRLKGKRVPVLAAVTRMAARRGESSEEKEGAGFVKAPLYLAAGVLASLIIFPQPLNYAAIAVVALGDGLASVVGRMYGRHHIPRTGGKTLEGTAAGMACAFLGAALFVPLPIAAVAAAAGMAAELFPVRAGHDNVAVPLLAGAAATVAGQMLPQSL
jgi:dolichol kinase